MQVMSLSVSLARRLGKHQLKIIVGAVVGAVGVAMMLLMLLRGVDGRGVLDHVLTVVRDAGPWMFFGAMAVLPAVGFPMSPFTLSAGPVFGPVMGLGGVITAAFAAIAVNVMIGYALARWAMHPLLEKVVVRLGYRLPRVPADQFWDWTILLRVTPGPPFFVQHLLLGLAHVPVRIYLIASLAVAWAYTVGIIVFGDALMQGKGGRVLFGVMCVVMVGVGVKLVRKHLARKRAAMAAAGAVVATVEGAEDGS